MDFIDDVDFVAALHGGKLAGVNQFAHVVDAVVAGGVNFHHIQAGTVGNAGAAFAGMAGGGSGAMGEAVEGFSENPRGGGLPRAAWAAKEVSVGDLATDHGVFKGLDDGGLADDFIELLGAVFAVQGNIGLYRWAAAGRVARLGEHIGGEERGHSERGLRLGR